MRPLSRCVRITLLLSTLVAAAVAPQALFIQEAKAQSSEKKKVAVGAFDGNKSGEVRSSVIDALKADGGFEVTDAEDLKGGKQKAMKEAAKNLAVNVIITGKVSKGFALKLKVYNGADGKVLDEVELKGGALAKLKANIEKTGASSVSAAMGDVQVEEKKEEKPPEAETPAEEEKPAEEAQAEVSLDSASASGGGLSPFDVTAGLRPMHRTFEFRNTLADARPNEGFSQLLRYELPLGPVLFIDLNFYPGSLVGTGPIEWIGITGGFEKGFAIESVAGEGKKDAAGKSLEQTLKTNEQQFYVGPRFRLPIGKHELGLIGTFGQHTFSLSGDEALSLIPDVKYTNVRVGLDGMFRFGDLLVGARVGKRFVLSTGALETAWFPNVKTSSLEAGVTVGYRLVSSLDLVAGFDWLRYAFDFNPVPNRPANSWPPVAGGAVDQYMTGHIAFRFHLPGKGEGEGEGEGAGAGAGEAAP
jgi:hypothetical protein